MRKIKTIEAEIANLLEEKDAATFETFRILVIYTYIYDCLHNTNHLMNIKKLYLENKDERIVKLSDTLYTEIRTLTRQRKKYLKCFNICDTIVKHFNKIFSFLNKLL